MEVGSLMKESEKPTFFNGDEHPSKDDEEIDFGYLEDFFPSADDGKISPAEKITSVAPGGSGWAGSGLRVGQNVVCRIIEVTEGGYNVILLEHHNLPGFVQESSLHQPGEDILAQFVCVYGGRALCTTLLTRQ